MTRALPVKRNASADETATAHSSSPFGDHCRGNTPPDRASGHIYHGLSPCVTRGTNQGRSESMPTRGSSPGSSLGRTRILTCLASDTAVAPAVEREVADLSCRSDSRCETVGGERMRLECDSCASPSSATGFGNSSQWKAASCHRSDCSKSGAAMDLPTRPSSLSRNLHPSPILSQSSLVRVEHWPCIV